MSATHYDEAYFAWQAPIGEFGGWANRTKFEAYIRPDDRVLDFGCGGGHLLRNLRCRQRAGIEINPAARQAASALGIAVYATTAEVPDDWADVIVSNNALEHTLHPLSELEGLLPKLRPGGTIVFVAPCESINHGYRPGDINRHLYSWSPMALGNLFTEAGFDVIESRPYKHKWPPRYRLWARFGRRVFDLACRMYARWETSWFQVRVVARRPAC